MSVPQGRLLTTVMINLLLNEHAAMGTRGLAPE